jgi:3' terminal RNA ribose 2'-O-methyltransferase Hen1
MHRRRLDEVLDAIRASGARTVIDLGCGDGALLMQLAREPGIERITGVDVSAEALRTLERRLAEAPGWVAGKVTLIQRSLTEPGPAAERFDAAVLVETIEHVNPDRLSTVERAVFRELRPATVVVTTPNADFNPLLGVPSHRFRHPEHRFEWGRAKFAAWADGVARRNGFQVALADIAGAHPAFGGPTQMAVFRRDGDRRGRNQG